MTTSLPKIKTLADNSQSGSQKQLKFKKLKLSTDQSATDIRDRFKSVRTERLSSLQRYSTVQGQRQYKKQKIHLNLLQRKLLSGTYDQTKETGNDLNQLKQKRDYYKTQSAQKQVQTQKTQRLIQQIKIQVANYEAIKKKNEQQVLKSQKKYEQQKIKTEGLLYERGSLQLMIDQRKKINLFLQSQVNEHKAYLLQLKSIMKQVQTQARQSAQNKKNLMSKIEKINQQVSRQQKKREQFIFQKQSTINKRKDDQKFRQDKSKEFKKSLDQAQQQAELKDFTDLYKGILAHLFIRKYNHITLEELQNKYQVVENMFNQISSYQKFNKEQPQEMVIRYSQLKPQTVAYEDKIAKLQKKQLQLETKNSQLQRKRKQSTIVSLKSNDLKTNNHLDQQQEQQKKQNSHQRKLQNISQQTKNINEKFHKIERWSQRYAKQFEMKFKKAESPEDVSQNILNIFKVVLAQKQIHVPRNEKK